MRNPATATPAASTTMAMTATTRNNGGSKTPCCSKVGLKRGPWTPEEDELLASYIKKEGEGRWRTLPKRAGLLRCGKSCRLRWMNYLRPSVKRGLIAPDEEDLILRLHRLLGNRWSLIAGRIPGRTDNEIKNYWNTHLSKKLISQGIDPRTHKPLNPNNHCSPTTKASASGAAAAAATHIPKPSSNNNNLASSSSLEETADKDYNMNDDIEYFHNNNITTTAPYQAGILGHGYTGLLNCGGSAGIEEMNQTQTQTQTQAAAASRGIIGGCNDQLDDQEEDINYCADDVFSSFLNSLINEDAFANHNQITLQHHATSSTSAATGTAQAPDHAFLSNLTATTTTTTNFGLDQSWEFQPQS